eukprot:564660-Rhodomonas_salina.2
MHHSLNISISIASASGDGIQQQGKTRRVEVKNKEGVSYANHSGDPVTEPPKQLFQHGALQHKHYAGNVSDTGHSIAGA